MKLSTKEQEPGPTTKEANKMNPRLIVPDLIADIEIEELIVNTKAHQIYFYLALCSVIQTRSYGNI